MKKILISICFLFIVFISFSFNSVKAYTKRVLGSNITVTYTSGDGNGEDVTVIQPVLAAGTKGVNDYTDYKIVFARNNSKINVGTSDNPVYIDNINYTHDVDSSGYSYVLTGWRLISVTTTEKTYTEFIAPENQNYADINNAQKDINMIFAQEGWYCLPNNVTEIVVEAVYGRAIYVRSPFDIMYYDEYHGFVYGANHEGSKLVYSSTAPADKLINGIATPKSSDDNTGKNENDAVATLKRAYSLIASDASKTVYDNVILVCGDFYEINRRPNLSNYQYIAGSVDGTYERYSSANFGYNSNVNKPVTIAGVKGTEKLFLQANSHNLDIRSSLRIDNINMSPLVANNIIDRYSIDWNTNPKSYRLNMVTNGNTLEVTETAPSASIQFVWANDSSSIILNNGQWHLFVSWIKTNKILNENMYFKVGGLVYCSRLCNSIGQDVIPTNDAYLTNPVTLVVTGGKIERLYGSPVKEKLNNKGDTNIFMSGGYVINFYGGDQGSIFASSTEPGDVNIVTYGGRIGTFYGAGQKYTSNISGDVNIELNNTLITGSLYGGGKGGTVSGNINLEINNSTINGNVFGAGQGLTDKIDHITQWSSASSSSPLSLAIERYNAAATTAGNPLWNEAPSKFPIYDSVNSQIITRIYHSYSVGESNNNLFLNTSKVSMTLSEVSGNINLDINDSTIKNNVYGGGSISIVLGNIDVNLDNSQINGSLFGGGDGTSNIGSAKLYLPIKQSDYKVISAVGKDAENELGTFYWNNNIDILNYFKGIYDGVNQVVYNEDGTVTPFSELSDEAKAIAGDFGTQQLIYFANTDKLGMVYGNIDITLNKTNVVNAVYGGGNKGQTNGYVSVNINSTKNDLKNVWGGANQANIGGDVTLNIEQGNITNAFGGNNITGIIDGKVSVNVNNGAIKYLYGGGNKANDDYTTNVTINNGDISTLYGGGKEATVGEIGLEINSGSITDLYGGGDQGKTLMNVLVNVTGGTITNLYSGANQADILGDVRTTVNGGTITNLYGGNNISGKINGNVYIDVENANITGALYGGGNEADDDYTTNVTINSGIVNKLYGGGKDADISDSYITINGGTIIEDVFGGGFEGNVVNSDLKITEGVINNNVYGGGYAGDVTNTSITVSGGEVLNRLYGGGYEGDITSSYIMISKGNIQDNVYGGGYAGTAEQTDVNIDEAYGVFGSINIGGSVFGGGEGLSASVYQSTKVNVDLNIDIVVDEATNTTEEITSGKTEPIVTINSPVYSKINGNVYGGGDLGQVGSGIIDKNSNTANVLISGTTDVTVYNGYIGGSVFGGGSGIPHIGEPYDLKMGTIYGSTKTLINGGYITSNVYGGGTQSRLYQNDIKLLAANVNIIENNNVIVIGGSVFGGGDRGNSATTNASVPTTIGAVEVNITGKSTGSKIYFLKGGVYGDGNLCLVNGTRTINMKDFTTGDNKNLKTFYSLQRADVVNLDNSDVVLLGAIDLVEEGDLTVYSINRIKELNFDNGSTIKLDQIVKYLSKVNSDYEFVDGDSLVERPFISHGNNGSNNYNGNSVNSLTDTEITTYLASNNSLKNTICVANGLYLELMNTDNTYGVVKGLFTLQLLKAIPGEGGGFVYASINDDLGDFICETPYVKGDSKLMPVVDDVSGVDSYNNFTYYVWYIQGSFINYEIGITGYIGSEQLSYEEKTIIPEHTNKLDYVLKTVEVPLDNPLISAVLGVNNKYDLVDHNSGLKGKEIALEIKLGSDSLGYLMYDNGWGIKTNNGILRGYNDTIDEYSDNVLLEDFIVNRSNNNMSIILHKSTEVNAEIIGMQFSFEIDLFDNTGTMYSGGTSKLSYCVGFSIVRLVPEQNVYKDSGSLFAGVATNEEIKITNGSSFSMEYQTRYIPNAFPETAGRTMSWSLNVRGYSYYLDELGNYLTVDSEGNCINISPTLAFDTNKNGTEDVSENPDRKPFVVKNLSTGLYEYSHGEKQIKMNFMGSSNSSVIKKGTKITLIDLSDDKNPGYYYFIVNSDVTSELNLDLFMEMGTNKMIGSISEESSDYPLFKKIYKNKESTRVTERLVIIFDFEQCDNAAFDGLVTLNHRYGTESEKVDIMDYVNSKMGSSIDDISYVRSMPKTVDYEIVDSSVSDGIDDFEITFETTEYTDNEVLQLNINVSKDLIYDNTQYKNGEIGVILELNNGDSLPNGIEFIYNNVCLPKYGNKYVIVPIKIYGTHCVEIYNSLGFNPQVSGELIFKATLCYLPDDKFSNETILKINNISAISNACEVNLREKSTFKVTLNERIFSKEDTIIIEVLLSNSSEDLVKVTCLENRIFNFRILLEEGKGNLEIDFNDMPPIPTGSYTLLFEIDNYVEKINIIIE